MSARVRTFARTLRHIERLAGGRGRLLDVGTAAGAFLKAATDAGWDATGIEPNGWLAEWGRKQVRRLHPRRFDRERAVGRSVRRRHPLGRHRAHAGPDARARAGQRAAAAGRTAGRELPGHRQLDCPRARTALALPELGSPLLLHARHHAAQRWSARGSTRSRCGPITSGCSSNTSPHAERSSVRYCPAWHDPSHEACGCRNMRSLTGSGRRSSSPGRRARSHDPPGRVRVARTDGGCVKVAVSPSSRQRMNWLRLPGWPSKLLSQSCHFDSR